MSKSHLVTGTGAITLLSAILVSVSITRLTMSQQVEPGATLAGDESTDATSDSAQPGATSAKPPVPPKLPEPKGASASRPSTTCGSIPKRKR